MEKVMQMSNAVQLINLFPMNIKELGVILIQNYWFQFHNSHPVVCTKLDPPSM
jgi:hypothetical protein